MFLVFFWTNNLKFRYISYFKRERQHPNSYIDIDIWNSSKTACEIEYEIFKIFNMLILFIYLFIWPHGMRDLSSLTRDQTCAPAVEVQSLNHWATREVPSHVILDFFQVY